MGITRLSRDAHAGITLLEFSVQTDITIFTTTQPEHIHFIYLSTLTTDLTIDLYTFDLASNPSTSFIL